MSEFCLARTYSLQQRHGRIESDIVQHGGDAVLQIGDLDELNEETVGLVKSLQLVHRGIFELGKAGNLQDVSFIVIDCLLTVSG